MFPSVHESMLTVCSISPEGDAVGLRAVGRGDTGRVASIRTNSPGMDGHDVIASAVAEQRVLLTFDKDSCRLGVPASCGIVPFPIAPSQAGTVARTALSVLESRTDWAGRFSAIEETRTRITPPP